MFENRSYLTVAEAGVFAQVDDSTIRRWTHLPRNPLAYLKVGCRNSAVRISREELLRFLATHTQGVATADMVPAITEGHRE